MMKFHFGLTANMALMLALWSVAISASPIMSVIERLADHNAPGAPVVATFMRELELERANQKVWTSEYKELIKAYKENADYLNNIDLQTDDKESKDAVVCVKHGRLISYLTTDVENKWDQANAALEAKNELLKSIRSLLKDGDNVEQGLHCGDNPSEGADSLCKLLAKLERKAEMEGTELQNEKKAIEGHKKDINDYACDCTFSDWSEFSACEGGTIRTVTTYANCDVTKDESSCSKNVDAKCGTGKHSKTRTFMWGVKDGADSDGNSQPGKACPQTGSSVEVEGEDQVGDLTSIQKTEAGINEQTFRTDCKVGQYKGECPVDCVWGDWGIDDLRKVMCKDDDNDVLESCHTGDGDSLAKGSRSRMRSQTTVMANGGKPCFSEGYDDNGAKETETCYYHDNAKIEMGAEEKQCGKQTQLIQALKSKMCEGGGPCKNGGTCKVTINELGDGGNQVDLECTCPEYYSGPFCEYNQERPRCFDPSTYVELANGNKIAVDNISIGDKIASCPSAEEGNCENKNFDTVTIVSVIEKGGPFSAHTFVLENNVRINVTSPHLMYTYQRDGVKLVPVTTAAKDVTVDDIMMLQDGSFAKVIQVVDFQLSRKVQIITAGGSFFANGVLTTGMCEQYNSEDTLNIPASKVLKSYVDAHKDYFDCILAENEIRAPTAAVLNNCRSLMA